MADDLRQTGKPDDQRINIEQHHELTYWSKELGVSREQLREAVQTAGPFVRNVRQHLNPRRAMHRLLRKAGPSATDMIRADHARVMAAFHRYAEDARPAKKQAIARAISMALQVHARIEEEIFYPAMRSAGSVLLDDLEPEHQEMRTLIAQLSGMDPASAEFDQILLELMRCVIHHVADEETMLLPNAESLLADELGELGARMAKRRLELMAPRAMPGGALLLGAGALLAGLLLFRKRA